MRRTLALLTFAVMLFAGCSKSDMQNSSSQEGIEVLQTVTFTANLATDQTKTYTTKTDGAGASVNRCVIEVYRNGNLYKRDYSVVDQSTKKAVFSLQLPSNRTYDVLFWADCVTCAGDTPTDEELQVDNYYVTASGLHSVSIKGSYAGNDDKRDAFFGYQSCAVTQSGTSFTGIELKRPFAQMNVITTDVKEFGVSESDIPTGITVCIKKPYTVIDVQTGALSGNDSDLEYNGTLYNFPAFEDVQSVTQAKLSMDYIFASDTQEAIDITWTAKTSGASDIVHEFSSIPYKRNYRTNIIGNLLTSMNQWTVTVVPTWDGTYTKVIEVQDIQSANQAIEEHKNDAVIDIKFKDKPNDSGKPTGTSESGSRAILTTGIAEGSVLSIEVQTNTESLYVGDYEHDYNVDNGTVSANAAKVNINVPSGTKIGKLVVNAPSKSVYINGKEVSNVGTIDNLDAITSANTLIVAEDQTVGILTIRQGGLEIHGTVNSATVPEGHGAIYVRACEGLSETVYNTLEPYIDIDNGYTGELESGKTTYRIYQKDESEKVARIGDIKYYTLAAAFAAVPEGGQEPTVVEIILDFTTDGAVYNIDNKNIRIAGDNHTITAVKNEAGGCMFDIDSQSKVDIEDLNVTATGYSYVFVYDNDNVGATGTVTNVSVTSNGVPFAAAGEKTSLTLNNVTSAHNAPAATSTDYISTAVAAMSKASVSINGGVYTSDKYGAYVFTSGGTINISGAEITAPSAFKCDSYSQTPSIINVDGGSYSGKANVENNWGGSSGGSNSIINLKNGTFTNFSYSTEQFQYGWTQYVRVDITGGTYDADPTQCVVDGYNVAKTGENEWTVSE